MCCDCWNREGQPRIVTEATLLAVNLITTLYTLPGGDVGGHLHITTDDWNVSDHDLDYCEESITRFPPTSETDQDRVYYADLAEPGFQALERRIIEVLRTLTREERISALALQMGCFTPEEA